MSLDPPRGGKPERPRLLKFIRHTNEDFPTVVSHLEVRLILARLYDGVGHCAYAAVIDYVRASPKRLPP